VQMFTRGGFAESEATSGTTQSWDPGPARSDPTNGAVGPAECAASLRRTIEAEIIPRLMLAHLLPSNDACAPVDSRPELGAEEVEVLTELVLRRDSAAAQAYVRARHHAGLAVETLFLGLLSPVARRLGEMWEADLCDFTQVTVGLWRLQQLVFEYSDVFQRDRRMRACRRRALLAPAPGSQHTFGVVMVGEFFRRAGWDVRGDPSASLAEVKSCIVADSFDLLGLSLGAGCQAKAVSSAILRLRKASRNRAIVVMVGGPAVVLSPDFVNLVGADGTAPDAASAVTEAERLVARRVGAT
jgi:methanogenic corrinoid protein MtbC1